MDVMQVILNYGNYTTIDVVNGCMTIGISLDNFYQTHGNGD